MICSLADGAQGPDWQWCSNHAEVPDGQEWTSGGHWGTAGQDSQLGGPGMTDGVITLNVISGIWIEILFGILILINVSTGI